MSKVTALGMDTITEKSGHQRTGMAVSACTTPAAPSPVPIPYPTAGTVAEGIIGPPMCTKINGAKILTAGGCMKACHGNEPGTLKEGVSLNTGGPCLTWLGAPNVLIELGMPGEGKYGLSRFGRHLERRGADLMLITRDRVERVLRCTDERRFRLEEVRDLAGYTTTLTWEDEELAALTDCVGRRVERERNATRTFWWLRVIDAEGKPHRRLRVAYEFDARGYFVRVVDSGDAETEYRYDDEHTSW